MDRIANELDIEVIDLGDRNMSCYDYDHRNRSDDFEPLMQRVLEYEQIIFASPVYWYAVSPPMKIFLDRISDFLDLPDLLEQGRRLRSKTGYVVCTSIYDEVPASFIGAFRDTFDYLGMRFGGCAHVNCRDGIEPARHEAEALAFAHQVKNGVRR
ncbi:MAG: NAD(P)H-dependent oxidoreductase [Pseudomonadota bacterium]|nr:NAD(P)H-dependent oxidoreductase [Pseudomonadota bacterium]